MIRLIRQLFSNPFDYAQRFAAARRALRTTQGAVPQ
jgi:hypothetical protein